MLLQVHRNGDIGSPRVLDATSRSRAALNVGCSRSLELRPAPKARCRPGSSGFDDFSSAIPVRIVRSDIPVACATAVIPPLPNDIASAAAHRRLARSSKSATIALYFFLIDETVAASGMRA